MLDSDLPVIGESALSTVPAVLSPVPTMLSEVGRGSSDLGGVLSCFVRELVLCVKTQPMLRRIIVPVQPWEGLSQMLLKLLLGD